MVMPPYVQVLLNRIPVLVVNGVVCGERHPAVAVGGGVGMSSSIMTVGRAGGCATMSGIITCII